MNLRQGKSVTLTTSRKHERVRVGTLTPPVPLRGLGPLCTHGSLVLFSARGGDWGSRWDSWGGSAFPWASSQARSSLSRRLLARSARTRSTGASGHKGDPCSTAPSARTGERLHGLLSWGSQRGRSGRPAALVGTGRSERASKQVRRKRGAEGHRQSPSLISSSPFYVAHTKTVSPV